MKDSFTNPRPFDRAFEEDSHEESTPHFDLSRKKCPHRMTITLPRPFQVVALALFALGDANAAIALSNGVPYTQDFDTLPYLGSVNVKVTLPDYWTFSEAGSNADEIYAASTGIDATGGTYSYGSNLSFSRRDRAFGSLRNAACVSTFGASFTNNVGVGTIDISISYIGEQWRLGTTDRTDRLNFQYSTNATSITTGTWVDFDALDFMAPTTTGTFGAIDGNADENRTGILGTISSVSVADGATFWIRWSDFDATNADDGLAVDDFTIIAIPEPTTGALVVLGLAVICRRRRS